MRYHYSTSAWLKYVWNGGPRGRVVKVVAFIIALNHLKAVAGMGLRNTGVTCRTGQVLLAGCLVVFPGILPFHPTY